VIVVSLIDEGFLLLGTVALFVAWNWALWCMAAGFGVLQIVFGGVIARRYGG